MATTNETLVDESLLLYKILRRIPYGRWTSTIDIANELEASGIHINTRRLQRFLKRISSDEEFCVICDERSKPYGYRRFKRESDLSEVSLRAEEALLLRLSEERLKYLLPAPVIDSLRPMFDRARELMKEEAPNGDSAAWLKKVAVVPATVPVMPPEILPRIFKAVSRALWKNTKIEIQYINSEEAQTNGVVSPLGIVQQEQRIYLVCIFDGYTDIRHLALHRIQAAKETEFPSQRPKDFSLDDYVKSRHFNFSNGGKVRLSFMSSDKYLKQYLTETPFNRTQQISDLGKGNWSLEVTLDDTSLIDAWIAAWGDRFIKLKKTPIKLRTSVHRPKSIKHCYEKPAFPVD